ncbi:MAG: cytochrome c biogenesis protein ResB [Azoarcus sp.]|jgi:hypothetical protein|nr:cytochrome c biogenesis protein ResB [Azoarcus sp.]
MTRKLWQFPWGYPESALFVAGVAIVGFLLQLAVGHFDFYLLHAPANYIALALLAGLIALGVRYRDTALVRWVAGIPLAVALVVALLVFGLYMELTPQLSQLPTSAPDLVSRLGFTMVTSSWPFVLLYGILLVTLGISIARRLLHPSRRDAAFFCNHLGLWILLVSAGFGAADMQRVVMYVREGETQWRVHSKDEKTLELPVAITLRDFTLEEYPPRLAIIDRQSGEPQPEGRPEYYQIDPKRPTGRLGEWAVTLDGYLHEAVRIDGEYRASPMPESTPAAKVTARNVRSGESRTGWVSGGGRVPGFFSALTLDDHHTLAMTEPEPKRFASDIGVLAKDGSHVDAILEVNKPVALGDWTIYQYGYDTALGKMSPYSAMELVYDPWLLPARIGMCIMGLGALLLIWNGAGRRRRAQ